MTTSGTKRRPLLRALLVGVLVGCGPPLAVFGACAALFGISSSRGHGGGGYDVLLYLLLAGAVHALLALGWPVLRRRSIGGGAEAVVLGVGFGLGGVLALIGANLIHGGLPETHSFTEFLERTLYLLGWVTAEALVVALAWRVARGRATKVESSASSGLHLSTLGAGGIGLATAALALGATTGALVLAQEALSRLSLPVAGLLAAPLLCGAPALATLLLRDRLRSRRSARALGAGYGAAVGAVVLFAWVQEVGNPGAIEWSLALFVAALWIAAATLGTGRLWRGLVGER